MPMSKPGLSGELRAKIISKYGGDPDDSATLNKFCDAVAEAVIEHIVANATITFIAGDIPVVVSLTTGIGANTGGGGTGKVT